MSGTKKNLRTNRQEASIYNPFDTLGFVDNDDVLGANRGSSIGADYVVEKSKGNADVLNMVDLSKSFNALKEKENVFVNVGTSTAEKAFGFKPFIQRNKNVVLVDVLLVPEYNVSLLCVNKMIKDNKLVGTGSESGGLYLFDVDRYGMSDVGLCPYKVVSKEGYKYFLTIVDDYIRAIWVYLLKSKQKVGEYIESFIKLILTQFGLKIKVLSTWMAFRGNTRDLDSIWEETRQDCNFTQRGSKLAYSAWRRCRNSLRRLQDAQATASGTLVMALEVADLKNP
ncbi:ribonuclease H-like domain-containing protein [Tanacetum coccineum]